MFLENGLRKKSTAAANGTTSAEHVPHVNVDTIAGGYVATKSATLVIQPVRTVAGAYAPGDCVGTIYSLAGVLTAGKRYIIQSAHTKDLAGQAAQLEAWIFSADTGDHGNYLDNSAPTPDAPAADLAKVSVIQPVLGGEYFALGATQKVAISAGSSPAFVATGNERALIITRGTPTYASIAEMPVITLHLFEID